MIQDFPPLAWWSEHVVHPDDEAKFRTGKFHDYYRAKYAVASLFRPRRIAEIGVRWGYSAWSFLRACPCASYDGYDLQQGTHGGVKGADTFDWFLALVGRDFPAADVAVHRMDTQELDALDGPCELVHVDGDHTESGCRHDLELALAACAPGGVILVDDYDYIAGVRRATDRFCQERASQLAGRIALPTLRGDCLIRKAAV